MELLVLPPLQTRSGPHPWDIQRAAVCQLQTAQKEATELSQHTHKSMDFRQLINIPFFNANDSLNFGNKNYNPHILLY